MAVRYPGLTIAALAALAGCNSVDMDFRNLGGSPRAPEAVTEARPDPDGSGVISYPGYQVAIARRGDTVSDVAARVGVAPEELARFNGLQDGVPLRSGETLVIPGRSPEAQSAGAGIDVATLAGDAIDRADPGASAAPASSPTATVAAGPEPTRHRVEPGETAFSIARSYGVTPRALAEWNGLDADMSVRSGQILLIPVVREAASAGTQIASAPGAGSVAPLPPSAAAPLPVEEEAPAVAAAPPPPPSPALAETRTAAARFAMPVPGSIIKAFGEGEDDGIWISAGAGSNVKAADSGTVAAITRDTNEVPIVVIRHGGEGANLLTVYAGVADVAVQKGDTVGRGQTIAKVRATDRPFLHFEVREGFTAVDPVPYLN